MKAIIFLELLLLASLAMSAHLNRDEADNILDQEDEDGNPIEVGDLPEDSDPEVPSDDEIESFDTKKWEEEFKEKPTKEDEKKLEENLEKAKKEIEEQNKAYKEGKEQSFEKVTPLTGKDEKEIEKEKFGAKPIDTEDNPDEDVDDVIEGDAAKARGLGAIPMREEDEREEDRAFFDALDRTVTNTPASYKLDKSKLTPIKNQEQCGSCVAFATIGAMESCLLNNGAQAGIDLSEQTLVDCGYEYKFGSGCNGAASDSYVKLITEKLGGHSHSEAAYRYLNTNPNLKCPTNIPLYNAGAKMQKYYSTMECDEDKLKKLVAHFGHIGTSVKVNGQPFFNYGGGVYDKCGTSPRSEIDHAVTVVGYGTSDNGVDYWLLRNSWGTHWGENGYMKIKRGNNECGIGLECVVPICSNDPIPADIVPPKPQPPPQGPMWCDLTFQLGGPGMTGTYIYTYRQGGFGAVKKTEIICKNSQCYDKTRKIQNMCMDICGQSTCPASLYGY